MCFHDVLTFRTHGQSQMQTMHVNVNQHNHSLVRSALSSTLYSAPSAVRFSCC